MIRLNSIRKTGGARSRGCAWSPLIAAAAAAWALGGARAVAAPPTLPPARASARALLEEGRRRYGAGDFAGALAFFEEAERRAGPRLDPARARFNAGVALEKLGQSDPAGQSFGEALKTTDLETQAAAWYNKGVAELAQAERNAGEGRPTEARAPIEAALDSFRNAMRLAPEDLDAKINFEWALRRQQEMQESAQQQQQEQQQREQQEPQQQKPPQPTPGESPQDNQTPPDSGETPPKPEDSGSGETENEKRTGESDPSAEPASDGTPRDGQAREMSAEDARRLLDALRDEEDAQRRQMRVRLGQPVPVEKDW